MNARSDEDRAFEFDAVGFGHVPAGASPSGFGGTSS